MRPWQHALSSAKKNNKNWTDDLEIHEFLDSTKISCADRRHRLVLHHVDLGTELTQLAFPDRSDVADIVETHVIEDILFPAKLSDWMLQCDMEKLPLPIKYRFEAGKDNLVKMICNRLPDGSEDFVGQVYDLLHLPEKYYPEAPEQALCVLMNAAGPGLVRRLLGPPEELDIEGKKIIIDKAWIAEAVIFATYGTIVDLGDIVKHCFSEPEKK